MLTHETHIEYTRNELMNNPYYIQMIHFLNEAKIISYLDIGSNVGEVCNVLFEKIPTLKEAHLVEPEIGNLNFSKNRLNNDVVKFYNVAISYNLINPKLVLDDVNVGAHKLIQDQSGVSVDVATLEELHLPIVDFVKIDIEGMEYNVIKNSKYLQSIRIVDIEFHHPDVHDSLEYVQTYMKNHSVILTGSGAHKNTRCLLIKIHNE